MTMGRSQAPSLTLNSSFSSCARRPGVAVLHSGSSNMGTSQQGVIWDKNNRVHSLTW